MFFVGGGGRAGCWEIPFSFYFLKGNVRQKS